MHRHSQSFLSAIIKSIICIAVCVLILFETSAVQAIAFAPTVTDLAMMPGETTSVAYSVANTAAEKKNYLVSLYDVTLDSSLESPEFAPLSAQESAWFSVDTYSFSLDAGSSRALTLSVHPDVSVSPKSFVLGLVVREAGEDNTLAVSSGVSGLVFITVGAPRVSAELADWSVTPRVTSVLTAFAQFTVTNDGERTLQPFGIVRITNMAGRVVAEENINPELHRVPVGDVRSFGAQIGSSEQSGFFDKLWREVIDHRVGVFTATLVAAPYPGADATLQATTRIVVFPWRSALIFCVLAVGAVKAIRHARRS